MRLLVTLRFWRLEKGTGSFCQGVCTTQLALYVAHNIGLNKPVWDPTQQTRRPIGTTPLHTAAHRQQP